MIKKILSKLIFALQLIWLTTSCDVAEESYREIKLQLGDNPAELEPVAMASEKHRFVLVTLLKDLNQPWSMAFLPDGSLLITEKSGNLYHYNIKTGKKQPISGVPPTKIWGQGGLMDVLPHPDFANNRWVYLSYAGLMENDLAATRVARARLKGSQLEDLEILFTAQPPLKSGAHFGGALLFDDQGYLYISSGERHNRPLVQTLSNHIGKIIRLRDDGGIPADNPFIDSTDALPEIFSYGHRNPQGLAQQPTTRQIWSVEHGPRGGDEVNIIQSGNNYGWPVITYGQEYVGGKIGEGTHQSGMEQPAYYWVPSIAPSNMVFYQGDAFPHWRGNLLIGALKLTHINRLELNGNQVTHEERLINDQGIRIRRIVEGPQGLIYLLTDAGELLQMRPD